MINDLFACMRVQFTHCACNRNLVIEFDSRSQSLSFDAPVQDFVVDISSWNKVSD